MDFLVNEVDSKDSANNFKKMKHFTCKLTLTSLRVNAYNTGTNVTFPLFMQSSSSVGNVTIEFPMHFLHLYLDCTCQHHLNISYIHGKLVWP